MVITQTSYAEAQQRHMQKVQAKIQEMGRAWLGHAQSTFVYKPELQRCEQERFNKVN